MSLDIASLIIHDERLPRAARQALEDARRSSAESRIPLLLSAARILRDEVGIDCADARELVALGEYQRLEPEHAERDDERRDRDDDARTDEIRCTDLDAEPTRHLEPQETRERSDR